MGNFDRSIKRIAHTVTGYLAETYACFYLRKRGLRLIQRNYHCRGGEIDLIMRQQQCLVFVEVRYRRSTHFGNAAETVSRRKQQRLIKTAYLYLQKHSLTQQACRFDVITLHGLHPIVIEWLPDAFQANAF